MKGDKYLMNILLIAGLKKHKEMVITWVQL